MLRNAAVFVTLVAASFAHLLISPYVLPAAHGLTVVVNLIVVPFLLGTLAGYLINCGLILKLVILVLIPIAHVLAFGGDQGKPGLENVIAFFEVIPLWAGCLMAHILFRKRAQSTPVRDIAGL